MFPQNLNLHHVFEVVPHHHDNILICSQKVVSQAVEIGIHQSPKEQCTHYAVWYYRKQLNSHSLYSMPEIELPKVGDRFRKPLYADHINEYVDGRTVTEE